MWVVVFIESGDGDKVKVLDTVVENDAELSSIERLLRSVFVVERLLREHVEGKAEGEGEK